MELAGVVLGEAVVVGFAAMDRAVALPVFLAALEPRHIQPERGGQSWERERADGLVVIGHFSSLYTHACFSASVGVQKGLCRNGNISSACPQTTSLETCRVT